MKPCFIITAYDQVSLVLANIQRIRNKYPAEINNAPVIVVSTHDDDLFSTHLQKITGVHFYHYKDAPANKANHTFVSKDNPSGPYPHWRIEFLPPRILMSIQKGLQVAADLQCTSALHLHSDTYWEPKHIGRFLDEIKQINNYLFIGDLSYPNELSSYQHQCIPPFFHFQPEGLHINIIKAKETGYVNFEYIWDTKSDFETHNYGSIEALIGQYAHYCLTGKCVTQINSKTEAGYYKYVKARTIRNYHGKFGYGLVNLADEETPPYPLKFKLKLWLLARYAKGYFFLKSHRVI